MIKLNNLSLIFPHKICFKDFSVNIDDNDRIAIIGRNGSGKSSLLKLIHEEIGGCKSFLVPQIIIENEKLSGGERFNKKLSEALSRNPEFLLLDEPTNHLDMFNRHSLILMMKKYHGTIIMATHDVEVLHNCASMIWHIKNGEVVIFYGNYYDYIVEQKQKADLISKKLSSLKTQEKILREKFNKNQEKADKSRIIGEKKIVNKKWMKVVGNSKASRAEKSQGKILQDLNNNKKELAQSLYEIFIPEIIKPKFNFEGINFGDSFAIIDGAIGYSPNDFIIRDININLEHNLAILGDNGSGKTTLVRAIMNDTSVYKLGQWNIPKKIGYIDQHYSILDENKTPFKTIKECAPSWNDKEIRRYLNDY